MDKMNNVKRRLITSMIAMVLLIITIVGITYAYFTPQEAEDFKPTIIIVDDNNKII